MSPSETPRCDRRCCAGAAVAEVGGRSYCESCERDARILAERRARAARLSANLASLRSQRGRPSS